MADRDDLDLTDAERRALHECQLAIEYIHRSHGELLGFHHKLGHAMDRFYAAEKLLRSAGHEELADELRDEHLPAGAVDDSWSYELVEDYRTGMLDRLVAFEDEVREELAGGLGHVSERQQREQWRERAGRER
jgi:hypothetical protein